MWWYFGSLYESLVFVYGTFLLITYAMLAVFSFIAIRLYNKKNDGVKFDTLLRSPLAPGISIIAPAFNEGLTIISNVKSLLTLNYPKYEIIIINDGSTDDTLEKMIAEFSLVPIDFAYNEKIITRPVRQIYKSSTVMFSRLMVIDKYNGKSKADASNAGINAASYSYFVCTDVDCILDKDTLLELIKPVMQEANNRVIAIGATLRLANSCEFEDGLMTRMRPPREWLPRFQEVEYIRAFILGKMGWSLLNSVPNVSGGLGLFDKEIAIKAGGYDHQSFGEDMELMVRMCRYCYDNRIAYAIRYIPKTLCWTEGPSSVKIFMRQRTRWARGLAQLTFAHFPMFMKSRYGKMGLIVFPYTFFFELLAPIIEILGIGYYIILICCGLINWPYAMLMLLFVYSFSIMITTVAILYDQISFRHYKSWKEVLLLCITPFFEFLFYHPMVTFFSLRGYYFFLTGKQHSWGNMQRKGFNNKVQTPTAASLPPVFHT